LTPPLTERDVKDIADGRLLVYMFGFITYHDPRGNHETQFYVVIFNHPQIQLPLAFLCGWAQSNAVTLEAL